MRPSRPLAHRIAVGVMLFADSACTISISMDVCLAVLRTPLTPTTFRLIFEPMVVTIFATAMSSVVAQLFLCRLLCALSVALSLNLVLLICFSSLQNEERARHRRTGPHDIRSCKLIHPNARAIKLDATSLQLGLSWASGLLFLRRERGMDGIVSSTTT